MDIRVGILTAPHIQFEQREHTFLLRNVNIGIGFHWNRTEDQLFEGKLDIIRDSNGMETAVNTIDLESYISSVISSEMSAHSSMELLKAHAVISRSWAIRAIQHALHTNYDVCADDHCQRYEGLLRRNQQAINATQATRGQVLQFGQEICDTRYHKCCGGKTEQYETCWEDTHIPYLTSTDCPYCKKAVNQSALLQRILNNYDQETPDFHDWVVHYSNEELDQIIANKSGINFGHICQLIPVEYGTSGRICQLRIVGTNHSLTIGKELKIRQWLSPSCLYSSWFNILHNETTWTLNGHGWGHGVGLCQIGAAVMAEQGYSYSEILSKYYPGSHLYTLKTD